MHITPPAHTFSTREGADRRSDPVQGRSPTNVREGTVMGHSRPVDRGPSTSGLPLPTDIVRPPLHVSKGPGGDVRVDRHLEHCIIPAEIKELVAVVTDAVCIGHQLGKNGWSRFQLSVGPTSVVVGPFGYITDAFLI